MHPINQLTLGLSLNDEATFNNFYAGQNSEMVCALKETASGKGERMIYLCGARGEGCSHLLNASCHYAHQHHFRSVYLPLNQLIHLSPDMLNGLETLALVCIDDLHVAAAHPEWVMAIFHLYNRLQAAGGALLVAAHDLPKSLQLPLPDLVSRLASGIVYQIHPLSDVEKLTVLIMRAKRRGIALSEEVGKYILTHCPRHMDALVTTLDALDKASLAAQRRLTIPFVKEVLHI